VDSRQTKATIEPVSCFEMSVIARVPRLRMVPGPRTIPGLRTVPRLRSVPGLRTFPDLSSELDGMLELAVAETECIRQIVELRAQALGVGNVEETYKFVGDLRKGMQSRKIVYDEIIRIGRELGERRRLSAQLGTGITKATGKPAMHKSKAETTEAPKASKTGVEHSTTLLKMLTGSTTTTGKPASGFGMLATPETVTKLSAIDSISKLAKLEEKSIRQLEELRAKALASGSTKATDSYASDLRIRMKSSTVAATGVAKIEADLEKKMMEKRLATELAAGSTQTIRDQTISILKLMGAFGPSKLSSL